MSNPQKFVRTNESKLEDDNSNAELGKDVIKGAAKGAVAGAAKGAVTGALEGALDQVHKSEEQAAEIKLQNQAKSTQ